MKMRLTFTFVFFILLKLTAQENNFKLHFCRELTNFSNQKTGNYIGPDIKSYFKLSDTNFITTVYEVQNYTLQNWLCNWLNNYKNALPEQIQFYNEQCVQLIKDSFTTCENLSRGSHYISLRSDSNIKYNFDILRDSILYLSVDWYNEKNLSILINLNSGLEVSLFDFLIDDEKVLLLNFIYNRIENKWCLRDDGVRLNLFPKLRLIRTSSKALTRSLYFDFSIDQINSSYPPIEDLIQDYLTFALNDVEKFLKQGNPFSILQQEINNY